MKFLEEIQTRHYARENCNIRTASVFVPKNPRTIHPQSYASGLVTTSKDVYAIRYERSAPVSSATGGKKGIKNIRSRRNIFECRAERTDRII
jgi:hypothetical protein